MDPSGAREAAPQTCEAALERAMGERVRRRGTPGGMLHCGESWTDEAIARTRSEPPDGREERPVRRP